jgi:hypothetical protein
MYGFVCVYVYVCASYYSLSCFLSRNYVVKWARSSNKVLVHGHILDTAEAIDLRDCASYERVRVCVCARACVCVCVKTNIHNTYIHTYIHTYTIYIHNTNTHVDMSTTFFSTQCILETYNPSQHDMYLYVCMNACLYIQIHMSYICACVYIYIYIYYNMYAHTDMCTTSSVPKQCILETYNPSQLDMYLYVYMNACTYTFMYVIYICACKYIYIYIHITICTHTQTCVRHSSVLKQCILETYNPSQNDMYLCTTFFSTSSVYSSDM